jgi:hypothetical protein
VSEDLVVGDTAKWRTGDFCVIQRHPLVGWWRNWWRRGCRRLGWWRDNRALVTAINLEANTVTLEVQEQIKGPTVRLHEFLCEAIDESCAWLGLS